MSVKNILMLSCAFSLSLGLGQVPVALAQAQVDNPVPQPAQQSQSQPSQQSQPVVVQAPAPTIVNNSGPARDSGAVAPRAYSGLKILGTGAALFGVSYAVTVITAAAISDVCNADSSSLGCRDVKWPIYIPVVGPFIQMGYVSGSGSNTAKALLGIDGVVQGAGLAMVIAGAVMHAQERRPARYAVTPFAGGGNVGLVGMGRF